MPITTGHRPHAALIDDFARRYTNRKTAHQYVAELTDLFAATGRTHPRFLTESDVLSWAGDRRLANNTIRNRLSRVCTFLRWCVRQGECDGQLVETLAGRDNPLRRIPRLYGKVQGKYPARWLEKDEAFTQLLGACDNTDVGRRNAIVLRLGLAGVRAAEIIRLRIDNLQLTASPPRLSWIGKGSRSRTIVPGDALLAVLNDYLSRYRAAIGRPLTADDPLVCREKPGSGQGNLSWSRRIEQTCSVRRIVQRAADQAGIGHLSPHDLRRTAAGILHRATDETGAHYFDLLDIQKVLDHTDPATTMRSYLDPMDTGVKERAARFLD